MTEIIKFHVFIQLIRISLNKYKVSEYIFIDLLNLAD